MWEILIYYYLFFLPPSSSSQVFHIILNFQDESGEDLQYVLSKPWVILQYFKLNYFQFIRMTEMGSYVKWFVIQVYPSVIRKLSE